MGENHVPAYLLLAGKVELLWSFSRAVPVCVQAAHPLCSSQHCQQSLADCAAVLLFFTKTKALAGETVSTPSGEPGKKYQGV